MKKYIILAACLLGTVLSCKKALDQQPQGVISSDQLNTPTNVDKMVIAAYSALGNENLHTSNSLWPWGSMRSGDAYKGGDGVGDNSEWNDYETFVTNQNTNSLTDQMWAQIYNNIARANNALLRVNTISASVYPNRTSRQGEMRFLRGNYCFMAKILWNHVPYIDENELTTNYINISNVALTSDQLWGKIAADFRFAVDNLPATQADKGRPNKFTAQAYLASWLIHWGLTIHFGPMPLFVWRASSGVIFIFPKQRENRWKKLKRIGVMAIAQKIFKSSINTKHEKNNIDMCDARSELFYQSTAWR